MLSLVLLLIFVVVAAALWFQGLWSNAITLVNLFLAMMLAFNYFEPVAALLMNVERSYTYLWDFLAIWGLFALSFGLLRLVTDVLSRTRVPFDFWVEIAGRTVLSLWIAWLFVGFTSASLHTAPLGANPIGFQQTPMSGNFLGMSPGRQWLAFMQSRSQGALGHGEAHQFDPESKFILKHHQRRVDFEGESEYRVR